MPRLGTRQLTRTSHPTWWSTIHGHGRATGAGTRRQDIHETNGGLSSDYRDGSELPFIVSVKAVKVQGIFINFPSIR